MRFVALTRGQVALVDDEDFEAVSRHRWHARVSGSLFYAQRTTPRPHKTEVSMHREIMSAVRGQEIDHINRDGLDNRKANLRFVTRQQNNANMRGRVGTSQFKGVCWSAYHHKWQAQIRRNGRNQTIGRFNTERAAAVAYDAAAFAQFGEYAWLNFPKEVSR